MSQLFVAAAIAASGVAAPVGLRDGPAWASGGGGTHGAPHAPGGRASCSAGDAADGAAGDNTPGLAKIEGKVGVKYTGQLVEWVKPGGAADRAGLQARMRIIRIKAAFDASPQCFLLRA
eukprot:gene8688-55861_t